MADQKISDMSPASGLTGVELVPLVQSGANVRSTTQAVADYANNELAVQGKLLPAGGAAGQALAKSSGTDYDVAWADVQEPLPTSTIAGRVLTQQSATPGDVDWSDPFFLSPGGFSGDVQFNSGFGGFSGAPTASVVDGDLALLATVSNPPPPAGKVKLAARSTLNSTWLTQVRPDGAEALLQERLLTVKRAEMSASGNSSASPPVFGMLAWTTTGSAGTDTTSSASFFAQARTWAVGSATTAGASCGLHYSQLIYGRGAQANAGGFLASWVFGISDAAAVANARLFVGFRGVAAAIPSSEPSALVNILGVGADTGETTLSFLVNDTVGNATKIGTGLSATSRSTDLYRLVIYAPPMATWVAMRLINLRTGVAVEQVFTTDLPDPTTLLTPHFWRNNGGTTLSVRLSISSFYSETYF